MPHLIFRATKQGDVKNASQELPSTLAAIVDCPQDYFTFYHDTGSYYSYGKETSMYPIVQILWFDRGQDVQDAFAEAVTEFLVRAGYSTAEMYFQKLEHEAYYENGEHF